MSTNDHGNAMERDRGTWPNFNMGLQYFRALVSPVRSSIQTSRLQTSSDGDVANRQESRSMAADNSAMQTEIIDNQSRQIQQLQYQVGILKTRRNRKLRSLKSNVLQAEIERDSAVRWSRNLQSKIIQAETERDDAVQQCENLISKLAQAEAERDDAIRQCNAEYRLVHSRDAHIVKLTEENSRLESLIRGLQEAALKSLNKKGPMPMEDHTIRDQLDALQDQIRCWTRKYSVPALADLDQISEPSKTGILDSLEGFCATTYWSSLVESLATWKDRIPALLLQALIAKDILAPMFRDPFFVWDGFSERSDMSGAMKMKNLYDTMEQVDKAEAHAWRSHMLRILSTDARPGMDRLSVEARNRENMLISMFLESEGFVHLLRPTNNVNEIDGRYKELEALYQNASDLALSLWKMGTDMNYVDQSDTPKFDISNTMMSAHRLHKLDENDHRLDGMNVLLCVQPAIVAYGSENEEPYDQPKVWARSVMLIDEGEEVLDWL